MMKRSLTLNYAILALILSTAPVYAKPSVEVAFSPHSGATNAIVKLIGEAKHSIKVAAYSFTSKDIAQALIEAHKHGIDVQVVLDKSNATAKYSSATFLANEKVPTRIDYKYAIMHSKFMIIDDTTVETGSFNYTKAAEEKNAENLVILRDYPEVVEKYQANWQKLWNESKVYAPKY